MKIAIVILACALLFGGVFGGLQAEQNVQRSETLLLLVGDYLRDDYMANLTKTRSPFRSEVGGQPQLVTVSKDDAGLDVMTVLAFHEGAADFLLRNGDLRVRAESGTGRTNLRFKIVDARHFTLGYDEFPPRSYSFVGNVGLFLDHSVLSGDYIDSRGRHYVFRPDGVAHFPDREFKYTVGADHTFCKFDYYYIQQEDSPFFAFRVANGTLEIFRTTGDLNEKIDDHPMLAIRLAVR
jgi:hypothetical protein